jgi:hypothetical protein
MPKTTRLFASAVPVALPDRAARFNSVATCVSDGFSASSSVLPSISLKEVLAYRDNRKRKGARSCW